MSRREYFVLLCMSMWLFHEKYEWVNPPTLNITGLRKLEMVITVKRKIEINGCRYDRGKYWWHMHVGTGGIVNSWLEGAWRCILTLAQFFNMRSHGGGIQLFVMMRS